MKLRLFVVQVLVLAAILFSISCKPSLITVTAPLDTVVITQEIVAPAATITVTETPTITEVLPSVCENILGQSEIIIVTAQQLWDDYMSDAGEANSFYLNKVLQVSGIVDSIIDSEGTKRSIVFSNSASKWFHVFCSLEDDSVLTAVVEGQHVIIQGICTGSLLSQVYVSNCAIIS